VKVGKEGCTCVKKNKNKNLVEGQVTHFFCVLP